MKTNTITLSAAFLAIASEQALLSALSGEALASDGEIIAALPLPKGFTATRAITKSVNDLVLGPDDGDATDDTFDMRSLRVSAGEPAYRIALNPAKLVALAAALGSGDMLVLELPASAESPIHVLPAAGISGDGFIMPLPVEGMAEGLLGTSNIERRTSKDENPPVELPEPVVRSVEERGTLEIDFGGKPAKEILDALKHPSLGFRYSGRGTKRGVPANHWYGPDNPYTRQKITDLLKAPITQAAA